MYLNNNHEHREPKRIIISTSKIKLDNNLNNIETNEETKKIAFENGTEIAIDSIYNKSSLKYLVKKYKLEEKDILFCIKHFGGYVVKYTDNFQTQKIIRGIWKSSVSFETKLAIIINYFDRNMDMKHLEKMYGFPAHSINSLIRSYIHESEKSGVKPIRTYRINNDISKEKKEENIMTNTENNILQMNSNNKIDSDAEKLIRSIYQKIPYEKKILIIKDYFENKEMPSTISKKYSLDVTVINNLVSKVKAAKFFDYNKNIDKNAIKNSTKTQKKALILSIIKEQEGSGCSWKELSEKYNVNYQYLIIKKNKYLEKRKHKIIPTESQANISGQSYQEKINDLELEIVRLKKIIDHLMK